MEQSTEQRYDDDCLATPARTTIGIAQASELMRAAAVRASTAVSAMQARIQPAWDTVPNITDNYRGETTEQPIVIGTADPSHVSPEDSDQMLAAASDMRTAAAALNENAFRLCAMAGARPDGLFEIRPRRLRYRDESLCPTRTLDEREWDRQHAVQDRRAVTRRLNQLRRRKAGPNGQRYAG